MATAVDEPADTARYDGVVLDIPPRREFVRSPSDVLGLVVAVVVTLLGLGLAVAFQDALVGFEQDLLFDDPRVEPDGLRVWRWQGHIPRLPAPGPPIILGPRPPVPPDCPSLFAPCYDVETRNCHCAAGGA